MNAVTTKCPACEAVVELETDPPLEVGECVVCDQCDEALTVVSVSPLELEIDDEDDDMEDEDDLDLEEEDADDGLDDFEDDEDE